TVPTLFPYTTLFRAEARFVIELDGPEPAIQEEETESIKKIKAILDEYIRPAVEQDGGAITYHSFQDGVVKVKLQGSCSGCPSSIDRKSTRLNSSHVK